VESLVAKGRESEIIELHMHDPLCVHYALLDDDARKEWVIERDADVRVECTGTWTRGMTLLDQRTRGKRPFEKRPEKSEDEGTEGEDTASGDYQGVDDDEGGWRGGTGNRVDIVWGSSSVEGGNLRTVEAMAETIWDLRG
jgi:hypothetical protein